MGITGTQLLHHHLLLLSPYQIFTTLLPFLSFLLLPTLAGDVLSLVYKGCANQTLSAAYSYIHPLASVSSTLTAQATTTKFYKVTASSSSLGGQPLFALFQCRGDLSSSACSACSACVTRVLPMWTSLCGVSVAAARVQLNGCYALYQAPGFPQVSGTQMLYKTCGAGGSGSDFETKRDTVFAQLQSGVAAGHGFYATSYASVYAMAQCEGHLSVSDCGDCVAQAVQKSEVECGGAASGQIYLDKCYVNYSYYTNGIPHGAGSVGGEGQTEKTVAIVVGSAAGVAFLVICLLFARILMKKKDGMCF